MDKVSNASVDVLARLLLSQSRSAAIETATMLRHESLASATPERAELWERVLIAISKFRPH